MAEDDDFRQFVEVHYTDLLRTAYLLTGSREIAQDLVHDALLKTMRHWKKVHEPMAYVRRVMVNDRTSRWRRLGLRELLTAAVPDRARPDSSDTVVAQDELLTALQRLPARMRAVLVLRYWEDLSEADVATMLGCSIGTVKSQAARGLTRLRDVLQPSAQASTLTTHPIGGRA